MKNKNIIDYHDAMMFLENLFKNIVDERTKVSLDNDHMHDFRKSLDVIFEKDIKQLNKIDDLKKQLRNKKMYSWELLTKDYFKLLAEECKVYDEKFINQYFHGEFRKTYFPMFKKVMLLEDEWVQARNKQVDLVKGERDIQNDIIKDIKQHCHNCPCDCETKDYVCPVFKYRD